MRIRSIRPEFWSSEDVAEMSWATRLVFIGLWSYVDDNGVGRDDARLITAALFPLDENLTECSVRVRGALTHLSEHGQIVRYRVSGRAYLHICAWNRHQKIERASKGRYPLPTCEDAEFTEPSPNTHRALTDMSPLGEGEKGRRGEGEKGIENTSSPAAPSMDRSSFDAFWSVYPRKVGKDKARAAWRSAVKRAGSVEVIEQGARRMAADPNIPEPQFIPHPATWLNRGGWNDDPYPPRMNGAQQMASRHDDNAAAVMRMQLREDAMRNGTATLIEIEAGR